MLGSSVTACLRATDCLNHVTTVNQEVVLLILQLLAQIRATKQESQTENISSMKSLLSHDSKASDQQKQTLPQLPWVYFLEIVHFSVFDDPKMFFCVCCSYKFRRVNAMKQLRAITFVPYTREN